LLVSFYGFVVYFASIIHVLIHVTRLTLRLFVETHALLFGSTSFLIEKSSEEMTELSALFT